MCNLQHSDKFTKTAWRASALMMAAFPLVNTPRNVSQTSITPRTPRLPRMLAYIDIHDHLSPCVCSTSLARASHGSRISTIISPQYNTFCTGADRAVAWVPCAHISSLKKRLFTTLRFLFLLTLSVVHDSSTVD
jgi:hypothetical protein